MGFQYTEHYNYLETICSLGDNMAAVTSAAIMCNFYPQFITKVTRVGFPARNFKNVIILKAAWMGEQIMLRISLLSIPFPLHNSPLEFR